MFLDHQYHGPDIIDRYLVLLNFSFYSEAFSSTHDLVSVIMKFRNDVSDIENVVRCQTRRESAQRLLSGSFNLLSWGIACFVIH